MKNLSLVLILLAVYVHGVDTRAQGPVLLVSLNADRQVAVVDPVTRKVLSTMPSPSGPHEITVSRDNSRAYIADSGTGPSAPPGDSIVVFDLKTRTSLATLKACPQAHDTRVSRDGRLLWVACAPMKAVLEMDAATGAVRKIWNTGLDGGWFVEVTRDERKLYVPHLEGKALTSIDRTTGLVRTALSGTTQFAVAISSNGREMWASDADENKLSIIDTSSDRVVDTVSLDAGEKKQRGFSRLRFTPDGRTVVVVRQSKFIVVDAKRRSILWSVDLPYEGKVVTVSSDSRNAYVSHPEHDRISVIDLLNRKIDSTFIVGKQPDGLAWVENDRRK